MNLRSQCAVLVIGILWSLHALGATIVNINSITNNPSNPVLLSFEPGLYKATQIGTLEGGLYDSWNAWGGNVSGCAGNGANCAEGWLNWFNIFVPGLGELAFGSDNGPYISAVDSLAQAPNYPVFEIFAPITFEFFIDDGFFDDNIGGISLLVEPVPVPASIIFLASALVPLLGQFGSRLRASWSWSAT